MIGSSVRRCVCARVWKITFGAVPGRRASVGEASIRIVWTPRFHASIGTWKPSVMTVPHARILRFPPAAWTARVMSVRSCAW